MPDSTLLDEFCDALWLEDGLSRNTLDSYRRDLRQFQAWLEKMHGRDLLTATHGDLLGYLGFKVAGKAKATSTSRCKATYPICCKATYTIFCKTTVWNASFCKNICKNNITLNNLNTKYATKYYSNIRYYELK